MEKMKHLISMVFKRDTIAMKRYAKAVQRNERKRAKEIRMVANTVHKIYNAK